MRRSACRSLLPRSRRLVCSLGLGIGLRYGLASTLQCGGAFALGHQAWRSYLHRTSSVASAAGQKHGDAAASAMAQFEGKMSDIPEDPLDMDLQEVSALGFMESANYASGLCKALQADPGNSALQSRVSSMLSHSDGARGFFVTFLTDRGLKELVEVDGGLHPALQDALQKSSLDVILPLAIMNVMMPTATALEHEANGDDEAASGSKHTAGVAKKVLKVLLEAETADQAEVAKKELKAVRAAAAAKDSDSVAEEGRWGKFFRRWAYDSEQMEAVRGALDELLPAAPASDS